MRILCFFCFGMILLSCQEQYPGFEQVEDHLFQKILAFDNELEQQDSCAVVELLVEVSDTALNNKLVAKHKDNLPPWYFAEDVHLKRLKRYLQHMNPGDRVVFIDEQPGFPTTNDSVATIEVWWKSCYDQNEFEEKYISWLQKRELREAQRIRLFALDGGFVSSIVQPEVLYRVEESGSGVPLKYGDEISIHYSGHFLDGTLFDDSQHAHAPLVFELGADGQVLEGLEYGLIGARPGEIRSVLIPSIFAYGEKGSSTGIVPPFTPLRYQVKVLAKPEDSAS